MADGDGRGGKDHIEGYDPKTKKQLDKISGLGQLKDLHKEEKENDRKVKEELQKEQQEMQALQSRLNETNEKYVHKKRELMTLQNQHKVELDAAQMNHITEMTKKTVDQFMQERKLDSVEEQEKPMDVDVTYFPGTELLGNDLRIGGEGAGSKQAKFPIKLTQKVKSLSKQAATYWGLDDEQVFFLDRDGRIVPEDMNLSEIVLPPVARPSPSANQASNDALGGNGTSTALVPHGEGGNDNAAHVLYTVRGRNYELTLVRASTVLHKEDLNRPKGETWNDFTFSAQNLEKELAETLNKHGDADMKVNPVDMNDIPSLYEMIEKGKQKKKQKRLDTMCRLFEFTIFIACWFLFQFLMFPVSNRPKIEFQISKKISFFISRFNMAEQRALGLTSFENITDETEVEAWLNGPFKRTVLAGRLAGDNIFSLGAYRHVFIPGHTPVTPLVPFCAAPPAVSPPAPPPAVVPPLHGTTTASGTTSAAAAGVSGAQPAGATASATILASGTQPSGTAPSLTTAAPVPGGTTQQSGAAPSPTTAAPVPIGTTGAPGAALSPTTAALAPIGTTGPQGAAPPPTTAAPPPTGTTQPSGIATTGRRLAGVTTGPQIPAGAATTAPQPPAGGGPSPTTGAPPGAPPTVAALANSGSTTPGVSNNTNATNATDNETPDDSSTGPSGPTGPACTPYQLRTCLNSRVIAILNDSIAKGDQTPQCRPLYSKGYTEVYWNGYSPDSQFSYVTGMMTSYSGGTRASVVIKDAATFDASLASLLADTPTDASAMVYLAFFYAPDVSSVYVYQMLYEDTLSGRLIATLRYLVIELEQPEPYEYAIWVLTVVLAIAVFAMEIRRILACPKRFTFEQERDHFSGWTLGFFLLPVLIFIGFMINSTRTLNKANDILKLDADNMITREAVNKLYQLYSLDYWMDRVKLAVLVVQNVLFVRYTLMYFPFVHFLTKMVVKITKPLLFTLFFLVCGFTVLGVFFYVMYCTSSGRFYDIPSTLMETVLVAQGGITNWQPLWELHSGLWTLVFFTGFVVISLILQNVTLAVMLSHKKEMDLCANYSYHPFWATAAIGKREKQEFNPSTIGWIFDDEGGEPKEPKDPTKEEG